MDYLDEKESKLLNKKIKQVSLPNDYTMQFELEEGGKVTWKATGDCCSESWFENISGLGLLYEGTVIKIEEREIPEEVQKALNPYRQESDQLYGYTLTVARDTYDSKYNTVQRYDRVDIEFRNSSNGYYGGSIYEDYEAPNSLEKKDSNTE